MKKKVICVIGSAVFLTAVWVATYNICLGSGYSNDSFITEEQLEEFDNRVGVFTDATVVVNDTEYELDTLTREVLGDIVVVSVKVNDRQVQGYVTYSEEVSSSEVRLSSDSKYAQIVLKDNMEG